MDDSTLLNSLSSTLPDVLQLPTVTPELSAAIQNLLDQFSNSPALTALNALSSLPLHPYDRLKYDLYGPEYKNIKFKTIDDIPAPTNFAVEEMLQAVINKTQSIQKTLLENLDHKPELFTNTMLNTVSGDKIIPNIEKHKQHIEFVELIRQIPIDESLSIEQIQEYSKKIISEFVKRY